MPGNSRIPWSIALHAPPSSRLLPDARSTNAFDGSCRPSPFARARSVPMAAFASMTHTFMCLLQVQFSYIYIYIQYIIHSVNSTNENIYMENLLNKQKKYIQPYSTSLSPKDLRISPCFINSHHMPSDNAAFSSEPTGPSNHETQALC